jgi:hypothetical protein
VACPSQNKKQKVRVWSGTKMGSLGFELAARKSYFPGVVQGFVATSFVQILRNGFYVVRLRQQVDGRSLEDEARRLWKEFPNGWMRGNVAHLLRNLASSAVMVHPPLH